MVQLKLYVYSGPQAQLPIYKSKHEVWLRAGEDMIFQPFNDDIYELDHEVFIPDGHTFCISTLNYGTYFDVQYRENVIKHIKVRMYEWSQDVLFLKSGEPVCKIELDVLQNDS